MTDQKQKPSSPSKDSKGQQQPPQPGEKWEKHSLDSPSIKDKSQPPKGGKTKN